MCVRVFVRVKWSHGPAGQVRRDCDVASNPSAQTGLAWSLLLAVLALSRVSVPSTKTNLTLRAQEDDHAFRALFSSCYPSSVPAAIIREGFLLSFSSGGSVSSEKSSNVRETVQSCLLPIIIVMAQLDSGRGLFAEVALFEYLPG